MKKTTGQEANYHECDSGNLFLSVGLDATVGRIFDLDGNTNTKRGKGDSTIFLLESHTCAHKKTKPVNTLSIQRDRQSGKIEVIH